DKSLDCTTGLESIGDDTIAPQRGRYVGRAIQVKCRNVCNSQYVGVPGVEHNPHRSIGIVHSNRVHEFLLELELQLGVDCQVDVKPRRCVSEYTPVGKKWPPACIA